MAVAIASLSGPALRRFISQHGVPVANFLLGLYSQYTAGLASNQQRLTFQEFRERTIPRFIETVRQKEIRLVAGAFNSAPTFVNYFQAAAIAAIPLAILEAAHAINRVGASLEAIRSELAITNVMHVQGWGEGGFGAYVYRFVRNEMASVDGTRGDADDIAHFFYVWHPDNDWHPSFEECQAEDPLGPNFGGYHYELPTICLRMRADREALIATTDYGGTAVFHLVTPCYQPLVVDTPFVFARELFPLVINGARHRGTDLVWLALGQRQETGTLELHQVGILPDTQNVIAKLGMIGFMGCFFGAAACDTFPPCAPAVMMFWQGGVASWMTVVASWVYEGISRPTVQVLGAAEFLI